MYEIATKKAGCPPAEILLVDDARTNLMAAEKQGWHVPLVRRLSARRVDRAHQRRA
jgi:HAD superfamily hydrolase (TIGR01509 family)